MGSVVVFPSVSHIINLIGYIRRISMIFKKLAWVILLIFSQLIHAEIITDGTLGKPVHLQAPNYQIPQELGTTVGPNLFHSFEQFNIHVGETATFSGTSTIENVISRVTGRNASIINGKLSNTIPNANTYLINPNGVLFGSNAQLDVKGSFHVSTADYLRLEDKGRFDARNPNDSVLTVASVDAFGFLTDTPAKIITRDSVLSVPSTKTLSLIGGDLEFQGIQPIQFDEPNIYATSASSIIKTTGGQLNLVAMGSGGEVVISHGNLSFTGHGGNIILNHTLVDTSGLGSGNLTVRGNQLHMQDSTLQSNTLGALDGGLMDIRLTGSLYATSEPYYFFAFASKTLGLGNAGSVAIKVPEFTLDRVILGTNTLTEANAGNIDIDVTQFNLLNGAGITPSSIGGGISGQLTINASESVFISGRSIGNYLINGTTFTDYSSFIENGNYPSKHDITEARGIHITTKLFDSVGGHITSLSFDQKKAADIIIQADDINIREGSIISSTKNGNIKNSAGDIRLIAKDTLSLSGYREGTFIIPIIGVMVKNFPSIIGSNTFGQGHGGEISLTAQQLNIAGGLVDASSFGQGKGGHVIIQADNVNITKGGMIGASAQATGAGGHIRLMVKNTLSLIGHREGDLIVPLTGIRLENWPSNIASLTVNQGQAGEINLTAQRIEITGGYISSSSSAQGQAGNIIVNADNINITEGGYISSAAYATGAAGNIQLTVKDHLSISGRMDGVRVIVVVGTQTENSPSGIFSDTYNQSQGGHIFVQTDSLDIDEGAVITSNSYSLGDAGQITLQANHLRLQHGSISTTATQSGGGNIFLTSSSGLLYLKNGEITTSVAAGLGKGGDITITNPTFVILNQGQIKAQADAGNGGNILIVAEQFIKSYESLVSASSRLGIDGQIEIYSPDETINGDCIQLPSSFEKQAYDIKKCRAKKHSERSNFTVKFLEGIPLNPEDLRSGLFF